MFVRAHSNVQTLGILCCSGAYSGITVAADGNTLQGISVGIYSGPCELRRCWTKGRVMKTPRLRTLRVRNKTFTSKFTPSIRVTAYSSGIENTQCCFQRQLRLGL